MSGGLAVVDAAGAMGVGSGAMIADLGEFARVAGLRCEDWLTGLS